MAPVLKSFWKVILSPIAAVVLLLLIAIALIEGPALDPFLYAVF